VLRFLVWAILAALKPKALSVSENLCPTAAVAGAAAQSPAAASRQCGPAVLDLRQSMVHWLAQFASYCEAGDGLEVVSTGLACLLAYGQNMETAGGTESYPAGG
jgi:hypothetical protein